MKSLNRKMLLYFFVFLALAIVGIAFVLYQQDTTLTYRQLHQDIITNADLWSNQAEILSAGYGFDSIIGVDGGEAEVRAVGGTWNNLSCSDGSEPERSALTSSAPETGLDMLFSHTVHHADGLPVVFSWPILPSTLQETDFLVTLNTGETLTPQAASIYPNYEFNERSVAVIFADFGNRLLPDDAGARYVIRVEIVADTSPLMLLGPDGLVSAVGLYKDSDSIPYESGPYLVGAKLSRFSAEGEGGPAFLRTTLPNDGFALYGEAAQYRLRVYTSGGFSPDGVTGVKPDEFSRYFRLHLTDSSGVTTLLTETGVDYAVEGGSIRVVGLADLGFAQSSYDDCYIEDHDNYIDIILAGDEAAMRNIRYVEIPATGDYSPFYNPGGPGNNPSPGIRYTAAGPADLEPVIMALDDPMTVSYQK